MKIKVTEVPLGPGTSTRCLGLNQAELAGGGGHCQCLLFMTVWARRSVEGLFLLSHVCPGQTNRPMRRPCAHTPVTPASGGHQT